MKEFTTEWYKREILIYGQQVIDKLNEPDKYEPVVHSSGKYRYLSIYDKQACDSRYFIKAATYADLYSAVQCAWNMHMFMERCF